MHRFSRLLTLVTFLAFIPTAHPTAAAPADEWQQYRHDPQRTGRAGSSYARGSDNRLHLQWAYALGERVEVEVEPIVAGGKVYVGAMNGTLTALDANTGTVAWTFRAGPFPHTAAYADGRIFIGSLDGNLYGLDAATGQERWRFATGGPVYAAPAVSGTTVYIGSTGGRFFALDTATGAERWRFPASGQPALAPFTGAAALSPDGTRLYVGNEDLNARALNAASGAPLWQTPLTGTGMRATFPVVSNDGAVVMFLTAKPGVQSYLPTEDYPKVAAGNNPVSTWNSYYQRFPERRSTFFLNASSGAELWDKAGSRYVPLPLPYWGLHAPVLDASGNAWMTVAGGAQGTDFGDFQLDHDSRLVKVALSSGNMTERAVRSQFGMRKDENGRATMAGAEYMTSISEDLGSYDTGSGAKAELFGNGFASHMDPIGALPSKHLWRYGGTVSMGGVPGASPPVVAGGLVYYLSYGWLYVLGPTNRGYDPLVNLPVTKPLAFPSADRRAHELTYPQDTPLALGAVSAELEQRVSALINAGPRPPSAKFDQPGGLMQDEVSGFQLFNTPGERIWILSQVLPRLSPDLQTRLKAFLKTEAQRDLLNASDYSYATDCLIFGQSGVKSDAACPSGGIVARWIRNDENLTGEKLAAIAAYAEATDDWASIDAAWSLIKTQFAGFTSAYNATLGFCVFPKWRTGKLGIAQQIGAAAAVKRMAEHKGDTATASAASTLLENLLTTRVKLGHFARDQYDAGQFQPLTIRLDPDGVPNRSDIANFNDPGELIPYSGNRTRDSDTRQVTWRDTTSTISHSTPGFMHYQGLVGTHLAYPELTARLRRDLLPEITNYVKSFEVNAPWWWMNDLAHHTTAGGEHLWHSPTLAYDMFQAKANVLNETWDQLRRELPLPASRDAQYDLYRIHNLATLVALAAPDLSSSQAVLGNTVIAPGQPTAYTFRALNIGSALSGPATLQITLPAQVSVAAGSLQANSGSVTQTGQQINWSGTLESGSLVTVQFQLQTSLSEARILQIGAQLSGPSVPTISRTSLLFLNGKRIVLPFTWR